LARVSDNKQAHTHVSMRERSSRGIHFLSFTWRFFQVFVWYRIWNERYRYKLEIFKWLQTK